MLSVSKLISYFCSHDFLWLGFIWHRPDLSGLSFRLSLNPVFLMCFSSSYRTTAKLLIPEAWEAKPYPPSTFQNCLHPAHIALKSHMTGSKTKEQRIPISHKEYGKGYIFFSNSTMYHISQNWSFMVFLTC